MRILAKEERRSVWCRYSDIHRDIFIQTHLAPRLVVVSKNHHDHVERKSWHDDDDDDDDNDESNMKYNEWNKP